ncbi:LamG-like jellyroll fold domain-containing protein [Rubritalea tangerina]|uniref:LamG-like jellyroll fold domain-containing protein n=2 Tax=Rubritalea tangerina TaxID=430798 RepID=A0ABW4ZBW8_9BACT
MSQLEEQIQELFEGVASEDTERLVAEQLRSSAEARSLYSKHARLHAALDHRALGLESLTNPEPVIPFEELQRGQRKRIGWWIAAASAAAITLMAIVLQQTLMPNPHGPLQLQSSRGAVYHLSATVENSGIAEGSEIILSEGVLKLTFSSGVTSIVEAPAQFTYKDHKTLYLLHGRAWCHVPDTATGFTLESPDMDVVDLGTEFAVYSTPNKADECYVFDGEVQVKARYGERQQQILTAGNGLEASGLGRLKAIDMDHRKFLTALPDGPLHLHWNLDAPEGNVYYAQSNFSNLEPPALRFMPDGRQSNGLVQGKFGNALRFAQSGDFAFSAWPGIGGKEKRTIAFWTKMPTGEQMQSEMSLLGWGRRRHSENAQSCFLIYAKAEASEQFTFCLTLGEGRVLSDIPVQADTWAHVAIVYHPEHESAFQVYINGEASNVTYAGFNGLNTLIDHPLSSPLKIGDSLTQDIRSNKDIPIGTTLDELHIIHDALSQEQVRTLMLESH